MQIDRKLLLATVLFFLVAPGHAAVAPRPGNLDYDPATVRAVYDHSPDLPDGDAFLAIMRAAQHFEDQTAIVWIQSGTGLSGPEAAELLDLLRSASAAFDAEFDRRVAAMACVATQRLSTNDVYGLFEAMDDLRTALAAQYFAAIKGTAGGERSAVLDQWVSSQKLNIVEIKQRHKTAYEKAGADPLQRLNAICDRLRSAVSRQAGDRR